MNFEDLELVHSGKVRKLYRAAPGKLLLVATDAISAYDHVLESTIPHKGAVLTQLTSWWFEQLADVIGNHALDEPVPGDISDRAMMVAELDMLPVECVVRGYLTGSGLVEYRESGTVCGIELPADLEDGSELPEPIFTPAHKAEVGEHDENISFDQLIELVGQERAEQLREVSLAIYRAAADIARDRGLILADTKFEFGLDSEGELVLADEVLTPDSSRYWDAARWQPGGAQPSFDKQIVRDWLRNESGWETGAPPELPDYVVRLTQERYFQVYRMLTGDEFQPKPEPSAPPAARAPVAHVVEGDSMEPMAKVIVEVMPKPEILDPQGKAVTGALGRMGYEGLTVRQGKRFEVEVEGEVTEEVLAQVTEAAEKLLANPVIESFIVRKEQ